MNYLDNPILLLHRHFIIRRQAQPSPEDICAYINSASCSVFIAPSSDFSFKFRITDWGAADAAAPFPFKSKFIEIRRKQ